VQVLNVEEEVEWGLELVKHPWFYLQRVQIGMYEELHFAETCVWAPWFMHLYGAIESLQVGNALNICSNFFVLGGPRA
jgi:hypothetical protein